MIFSRSSGSGGRHAAEEPRRSSNRSRRAGSSRAGDTGRSAGGSGRREAEYTDESAEMIEFEPEFGPYDITEAPEAERIDLGSLKIPAVAGVEVRVQANAEGAVQQVVLTNGESVLQLAAFAAPRSEGIWDEVRGRIRKSLSEEGVAVEETDGDYGRELRAQVRSDQGPTHIRFIGVDGPRWMVRAVYQGRAAGDPSAAGPLADCLRGLVVDRGKEAMPAEDALPLRLPQELAEQAREAAEAQAAEGNPPSDSAPESGSSRHGTSPNGYRPGGGSVATGSSTFGDAVGDGTITPTSSGTEETNGRVPGGNQSASPRRRPSPRPRRPE